MGLSTGMGMGIVIVAPIVPLLVGLPRPMQSLQMVFAMPSQVLKFFGLKTGAIRAPRF
jgi:hypothetical protein